MIESSSEVSAQPAPRIIGIVWLAYLAVGIISASLIKGIVVWVIGAAAWLIFLWPPLAIAVPRYVIVLGSTNELAFAIWLIVKGGAAAKARLAVAAAGAGA